MKCYSTHMSSSQPYTIRGSSFSFRLSLAIGLSSALGGLAVAVWSFSSTVYGLEFIALIFLIDAIRIGTQQIIIADGQLKVENFFVKQSVQLDQLVEAKHQRIPMLIQTARLVLKLKDAYGNRASIEPALFDDPDTITLANQLRPYVFRPSVDKNFIMFWFGGEPLKLPKVKPGQIVKGTLLYVLLPCLLLTAALVIWAMATNQPAFRQY